MYFGSKMCSRVKTVPATTIFLCLFLPLSQCQKFTITSPIPLPVQENETVTLHGYELLGAEGPQKVFYLFLFTGPIGLLACGSFAKRLRTKVILHGLETALGAVGLYASYMVSRFYGFGTPLIGGYILITSLALYFSLSISQLIKAVVFYFRSPIVRPSDRRV